MKQIYLLSIIILLALISSCKKDTSIGADILPHDDLLNVKFTDTFSLFSKTLTDTFLRTDKLAKNYLGVINDTKFGFQQASILMELEKPDKVYDDTLNTTVTIDSVRLYLYYRSFYGDTTTAQSFEVKTITSPTINENQAYYSNASSFFINPTPIGSANGYYFRPYSDLVHINTTDTIGLPGILRIKLDDQVGRDILSLGQTKLRDSTLFKNNFPGILVENSTTNGKGMAEVDINSSYSSITIFYKDKYGVQKDMRLYTSLLKNTSGIITSRVNGVNLFTNMLATDVQNTAVSGLISDSVNYVLGQGGTTVKISLPTITNLGKVAINKAELAITQIQQNSLNDFATPIYLVLLKRNALGSLDVLSTSDGVGILDTTGTDGFGNKIARYNFNISKYIQAVSKGLETNTDLYIATYRSGGTDGTINVLNSVASSSVINVGYTPSRIIVAGSNYSDARYKMKLNLTYTLIK